MQFCYFAPANWAPYYCYLDSILAPSWDHLEAIFGPSWAILGPSWLILGPLRAVLGPLWALLESGSATASPISKNLHFAYKRAPFWGRPEAVLGPSWGHLGAILGPSWAISGILGPSCAISGPSRGHPGSVLRHSSVMTSEDGRCIADFAKFALRLHESTILGFMVPTCCLLSPSWRHLLAVLRPSPGRLGPS